MIAVIGGTGRTGKYVVVKCPSSEFIGLRGHLVR